MTNNVLDALRRGLVVSCQAYPGEPMQMPLVMAAIAQAAVTGGAVGIRAQGVDDVELIRQSVDVPIIGLIKTGASGVFITPTVVDCIAVCEAGADIVALDGTTRPRPDGRPLTDSVQAVHDANRLVLADCASVDDAEMSLGAGADCLATTLAGYTDARPRSQGPDFDLLRELVDLSPVPVIAEGRIHTPADAARCLELGAHAVVVGTAITHPTSITRRFIEGLSSSRVERSDRSNSGAEVTQDGG